MEARRTIFQFIEAQMSSLISTFVDFTLTAFLVKFAGWWYVYGTLAGAVAGGATNCIINYNWTFKGSEQQKRTIMLRYILVWTGSLILNTTGTAIVANILSHDGTAKAFGIVMEAKTLVAVLVAILWNFTMQKKFVYKT
ncbi:MAG: GtrA family protein [Bacteroidaceae bacterium]|nr:GtrA family protein [Bacteroidaceae bacterium]